MRHMGIVLEEDLNQEIFKKFFLEMNEIVIGVLKSNNPIKLKFALTKKLCQNEDLVKTVNINEFVEDVEKLWSIQVRHDLDEQSLSIMTAKLEDSYKSLCDNYEILKYFFDSYADYLK